MNNTQQDAKTYIVNLIRAAFPCVFVVTQEENRVKRMLMEIASQLKYRILDWSITQGMVLVGSDKPIEGTAEPMGMLSAIAGGIDENGAHHGPKVPNKSAVLLRDFHLIMRDSNPLLISKLKEALEHCKNTNKVLVITGCTFGVPPEIEKSLVRVDLKLPSREELEAELKSIAETNGIDLNGNKEPILDAATGLTQEQASNAFALAAIEHKPARIEPASIAREKAQCIKQSGLLELQDPGNPDEIGGLDELKPWIHRRKRAYTKEAREYGLPSPKGVVLLGPPGCGKSLCAKAVSAIFGVPMLRLDMGKIFGGLVGKSEENMRMALSLAEAVAPCILFVDEAEKGFSGNKSSGSSDGGTTSRVLGTWLQWMQDKTAPVFVVATANDISLLPPELLRKGRLDEIFWVDLPTAKERRAIFKIHLAKRGRKTEAFDLDALVDATPEYTGAEIESAIVEAMFSAFDKDREVTTQDVLDAVGRTYPLSKTMKEDISKMRKWAEGRTRSASATEQTETGKRKVVA